MPPRKRKQEDDQDATKSFQQRTRMLSKSEESEEELEHFDPHGNFCSMTPIWSLIGCCVTEVLGPSQVS